MALGIFHDLGRNARNRLFHAYLFQEEEVAVRDDIPAAVSISEI
jgi:hypothetical protein